MGPAASARRARRCRQVAPRPEPAEAWPAASRRATSSTCPRRVRCRYGRRRPCEPSPSRWAWRPRRPRRGARLRRTSSGRAGAEPSADRRACCCASVSSARSPGRSRRRREAARASLDARPGFFLAGASRPRAGPQAHLAARRRRSCQRLRLGTRAQLQTSTQSLLCGRRAVLGDRSEDRMLAEEEPLDTSARLVIVVAREVAEILSLDLFRALACRPERYLVLDESTEVLVGLGLAADLHRRPVLLTDRDSFLGFERSHGSSPSFGGSGFLRRN